MHRTEALALLSVAHFFDHLFLLIFPTAAIALAPAWGLSYGEALALGTPTYALFALGTLPAGWLGDRLDRTMLIALFFLGTGASSVLVALAMGPTQLMLGLGLLGLFAALYHPVGLALVIDLAARPGRALAVNGIAGNMGLAGAAVFTGVLADGWGWRSAFLIPGALSLLIGGGLVWRRARAGPAPTRDALPAGEAGRAESTRQVTVLAVTCVAALFGGLVFNAVTVSLPKFFDERLAGPAGGLTLIGAYAGLVFAMAAFAQLPVGHLLDRCGARPVLISLLAGQILVLVVLSQGQGWIIVPLALVLVTLIFAEIPVTGWLLGRYVRSDLRSRALAVEYVLSLGVGSAVVPLSAALHQAGIGFGLQLPALAASATVVLVAASFLPGQRATSSVPDLAVRKPTRP